MSKPPDSSASAATLIAWNLRKWRTHGGQSQQDLSVSAGVDRTYVSRLERGIENPSIAVLERLASACGVHVSALLTIPQTHEETPRPLAAGRKTKSR